MTYPHSPLTRGDSATSSQTLLECARSLEEAGQFDAADSAYRAAALADDDPQLRLDWAAFLMRIEDFARAEQLYRELRLSTDRADRHIHSVLCNNLAAICRTTGRLAEANSLQGYSQRLSEETGLGDTEAAIDLTGQALNAMLNGDYIRAENLLLRSLELDCKETCLDGYADDCGNLGVLAGLRGRHAIGLRFLGRAYRLHRELCDDHGAGADLMNAAEIFLKLGRLRLAIKCLGRAIKCYERCGAARSGETARTRLLEIRRVQAVRSRDPLLN